MKLYVHVLLLCACAAALALASDTCTKTCIMKVFKCKREARRTKQFSVDDCCEDYIACFNECRPGTDPPCGSRAGKRGSWNKRTRYGGYNYGVEDSINLPYFV